MAADNTVDMENDGVTEHGDSRFMDYLSLFLRGKWILLITMVLAVAAMVVVTFLTDKVYEATCLVLVNPRQTQGQGPLSNIMEGSGAAKITTELAVLRSRNLALVVANQLLKNPYFDDTKNTWLPILLTSAGEGAPTVIANADDIAGRLRGSTDFVPQSESDIVRITARRNDPREAAIIANAYAAMYQEQSMNVSRARSRSAREFLESRLSEQRNTLAKAEESLKSYMEFSGIVSLDGLSSGLVSEMSQLEATRNALDIDIESSTKKLASMEKELPAKEATAMRNLGQASDQYIHLLQDELSRLEVKRDIIIAQNDPKVLGQTMYRQKLRDIEDQIATLKKNLQKRSSDLIQSIAPGQSSGSQDDPVGYIRTLKQNILTTKLEIQSLQSRKEALESLAHDYDARFQRLPTKTIELARRQREKISAEQLYTLVEQKFNESAIAEKSEFGYVDIVDLAVTPGGPVSPNPKRNLLLGVLMGFGLGVIIIVANDALDVRVRTPDQLRRKGLNCLTDVAPMNRELRRVRKEDRIPRDVKKFDQRVWLAFDPLSFLGESYRRMRTSLLHSQRDKKLQVFLVTSPNPGDGKTTTASNLALIFAESKQRVLLIDADLRRPAVHSVFATQSRPGLADFVLEKKTFDEVIEHNVLGNFDVMGCGTTVRNPSRVIGSQMMQSVLEEARKKYDWIILDSPPLLVVNDALMLSTLVDGTIITVSAGTTRLSALTRAMQYLSQGGSVCLGVVLNNFDPRKTYGRYYGGDRYGHYSSGNRYYTSSSGKT